MGKPTEKALGRERSVLSSREVPVWQSRSKDNDIGDALENSKAGRGEARHWQLMVRRAEQEFTHSRLSVTSTVLGTADTLVVKTSSFPRGSVGTVKWVLAHQSS